MRRVLRSLLMVIAIALVLGPSAIADATTAVLLSREELTDRSMLVVRVTVGKATTGESDDKSAIVTRTELVVQAYLKGEGAGSLVLEQMGGTYNGKTQRVLGDARLTPGEEAVVFLRKGDAGQVHLTALALSVYHVDGKGMVRRELDGLSLVKRQAGKIVPVEVPTEVPESVEHLMTDIVRIAGGK